MARVAAARGASTPRFVISTGFYSFGLTGANDPNFRTKFINIPWHSVLGNHDYGHTSNCQPGQITTPLAQLDPAIRQDWVNNQVWLRDTLNRSTADWKLIVGHHPPHSSGRYAPGVLEVQLAVQRLIKRSGAQVYFAGGGARRSTAGFGSTPTNPTSRFSKWGRMTEGFALVKVTLQELRVEYFHLDYRDGLSPAYTAYVRSGEFKMPVV
ncbi:hypothetical protein COHA_007819 [Chlorella ohadii]|uniref:Calcineurin-like phosphoesterase domain-containing protein n=1 Tax=Chlorella ohadii TaxID=2649997 RepID=A0AAD5DIL0_9CHLO|nr:hypothetical protein COHA_007819 [Chlorella ohadii]